MNEVIIIPGNSENRDFVCITDAESRPDPTHCWARAAAHCFHFKEFNYFVQLESAVTCMHAAALIMTKPLPPKRAVPIKWGWDKGWSA